MKSGMAMVSISGAKVRLLREEQNLTQLYLATAVEVTTETISRWERQEAPTVKRENGLKLAAALAVSVEEILAPVEQEEEPVAVVPRLAPAGAWKKEYWIAFLVLAVVVLFLFFYRQDNGAVRVTARRVLPGHSVAGQPFPVVIDVDFVSAKNSSFLLNEELPAACLVLQTFPRLTAAGEGGLKWIDKSGSGKRSFSYLASCSGEAGKEVSFSGFLLARESSKNKIFLNGQSRLRISSFHWADRDSNGIIDDEELLAVYDDFGRIAELKIDVEQVETIWMGSGYRWDGGRAIFEVIP